MTFSSRKKWLLETTLLCEFVDSNGRFDEFFEVLHMVWGGQFFVEPGENSMGMGRWMSFFVCLWSPTRWAPTSYKWSYKPYKWPYKLVAGVITLFIGVITPFITSRGPTL